jgi:tetratricopeptide (TPR) repeat protein/predicted Ser/Thr protein kinase
VLGKLFGETVEIAGRYRLGEQIGRGGLGFVHRARDLKLDRDVALKFPKGASANPEIVADLEREAKVLARLQHPNIVAVYDVGQSEQGVYLAMELIDGVSMSEWLAEGERTWREVVDVMRAAGEGLAAAHEAGVVHRDFKPSNVMIDGMGRVRVVDFGLAREVGEVEPATDRDGAAFETKAAGTPPYMAPEQFEGRVSAASDQFAFCTTIFEGICGRRPWSGRERGLASDEDRDRIARALRNRGMPRWIQRVVTRGLRREPELRFPSMGALCAALTRPPRRKVFPVLGAGLLAGAFMVSRAIAVDPCDVSSRIDSVWNEEARATVRALIVDAPMDTVELLDVAAGEWNALSSGSCEAHQKGETSPLLFELRRRCLEKVADGFSYALSEAESQRVTPQQVRDALTKTLNIQACADDEQLLLFGEATSDFEVNLDLIDEIDRGIARSWVQLNLGRPEEYFETLEELHRSNAGRPDVGYAGARVAFQYGTALTERDEFRRAEEVMRDALLRYTADPRAHTFVAELRGGLAVALSVDPERALEAKHLAEDAITMFGRDGLSSLQVPALTARARASALVGDASAAEESLDELWAIVRKYEADGWSGYDRNLPEIMLVAAEVRARLGQTDAAETDYERAIEAVRSSGTKSRVLAQALNNLAELRSRRDPSPQTAAYAEEAAALKDDLDDRRGAALSLMNAGTIHLRGGRPTDAAHAYERGLSMLPPSSEATRAALGKDLGLAYQAGRDYASAKSALLGALRAAEDAGLQETELRFDVEVILLQVALDQQDDGEARRRLETIRRLEQPHYSEYTRAEVEIAACRLDRVRDPDAARAAAQRARPLVENAADRGLAQQLRECMGD